MNGMVTIKGVDELVAMLKELPDKTAKKAIKPALREIAKEVRTKAKANVQRHKDTGLLLGSIRVTTMRDKPGYPIAVVVGVTKKSKFADKLAAQRKSLGKRFPNYPMMIERGYTRKGVHYPARPWLRPAMQSVEGHAPQIIARYMKAFMAELKAGRAA